MIWIRNGEQVTTATPSARAHLENSQLVVIDDPPLIKRHCRALARNRVATKYSKALRRSERQRCV